MYILLECGSSENKQKHIQNKTGGFRCRPKGLRNL